MRDVPFAELPRGSSFSIDRRRFLVLAGGAALGLALQPHLAWAKRVRRTTSSLQPWSLPETPPAGTLELSRALIAAAVLAPSHWNSQPWRFEVEGASIRLVADTGRSLPATDPDQRSMMISLGAALENLLIAARAYGLRPTVNYFPHGGAGSVVADVAWTNGNVPRDRALFTAIPERRTNRREYDRRGIFPQNRAQMLAQMPEGFRLHWLDDRDQLQALGRLAHHALKSRILDSRAQSEQFSWMRFGDDDARRRADGVTVDALEFGGPARWMAGRYFDPDSWFLRFGAQTAARQARSAFASAGAAALLTADRAGSPQWLRGGQVYERVALTATLLGIAHQPINAPIEIERFRGDVLRRFDAAGTEPLMMIRLGHARRPPSSVRRSVALVSSFRNS